MVSHQPLFAPIPLSPPRPSAGPPGDICDLRFASVGDSGRRIRSSTPSRRLMPPSALRASKDRHRSGCLFLLVYGVPARAFRCMSSDIFPGFSCLLVHRRAWAVTLEGEEGPILRRVAGFTGNY